MIRLTLDTKKCMTGLLLREIFDDLLLIEGSVTTFNKFTLDGYVHRDFYGEDPIPDTAYSSWGTLREFVFSIIKGKRTPLEFHFVFSLSPEGIQTVLRQYQLDYQPETIQGLYLNFHCDGSVLTCTTGSSLKIFTLDKSLDPAWDKWVQGFFHQHEIPFELS